MLRVILAMTLVMTVSACASRINPFNWFPDNRSQDIEVVERVETLDPRSLVREVVSLSIEQEPRGAVVTATGLPSVQGYWEADLVEVQREDGVVVYEFRVLPPLSQTRSGTQQSREVLAGTSLTTRELAGIRTIRVVGAENSRSVSRR